jgi:hypothetical protein
MRLLVASFLFAVVSVLPAVAQSNATAGLAGLGAGAALGSTSPNGTTPAPAAGSGAGNTPIEIQIMVFQGMKDIASEIAAITSSYYQGECKAAFDKDPKHQAVTTDRANLKTLTDKLATDSLALRGDRDSSDPNLGRIAAARKLVQEDDAQLAATKALLNIDLNALLDDTKNACSILVEDSTSSNQMALYQAVEGYYNHLQQVDDKVQGYFALQIPPSVTLGLTEGGTVPASDTIAITNASKTPRKVKDITVTGSAAFAVDTTGCDFKTLALNEACDLNVTFPRDGVTVQPDKPYAATVRITSGDPGSDATDTVQTVQLSGTVTAKVAEKPPGGKGPAGKKPGEKLFLAPAPASTAGGGTGSGGSTGGGGGGGSTTPLGLTYLGDLTTALGALKSSITYGATGFQPTAQSFQLLVEAELKAQGIFPLHFNFDSQSAGGNEQAEQSVRADAVMVQRHQRLGHSLQASCRRRAIAIRGSDQQRLHQPRCRRQPGGRPTDHYRIHEPDNVGQ